MTKENKEVLEVLEVEVEKEEAVIVSRMPEIKVSKESKNKAVKDISKSIKKLTLVDLKRESKKFDETAEFFITIGETEYKLTHDVYFRKTKQRQVLEDMLEFFNSINDDNISILEMATPYTALLIIKHFTSLDVSDDIQEALALLEILIDLSVIGAVVNALPEEEVVKIYELLTETVNNIKTNIEEAELEVQELSDKENENENETEEVVEDGTADTNE